MNGDLHRAESSIYEMSSRLGWTVIDSNVKYDESGRWSVNVFVDTDIGVGQFKAASEMDDVTLYPLRMDGFDPIHTPFESFCAEAARS